MILIRLLVFIALALALLTIATRFFSKARPGPSNGGTVRKPAVMKELRARLLKGTPSDFGLQPIGPVWGALMETGYHEATATLAAISDGSASLYFSSGGGVIGGGEHPEVNAASRRFVQLATEHLALLSTVSDFPYPELGGVKFYILTTNGVFGAEATEEGLGKGEHSLSALFFAGHDVITSLRELSEKRGK